MNLQKPALAAASPGHPITAQAWNALVTAILASYDALIALDQGSVLRVSVSFEGKVVRNARVVATQNGVAVQAVPPIGGEDNYVLGGLVEGQWSLRIEAPGFTVSEATVELPSAEPVSVVLAKDPGLVAVPDLFGMLGGEVAKVLAETSLKIETIFNAAGKGVAQSDFLISGSKTRVLMQLPPAGELLRTSTQRLRLIVSSDSKAVTLVPVPDHTGLTIEDAKAKLLKAGLSLGKVGELDEKLSK